MSEINEKVEALLQFNPISRADREYLENELLFEIALAERDRRWQDSLRLKRRLSELRGAKLPPEPQKTDEQRQLDSEIEKAEREGRVRDSIVLKRRRFGL